jgi:hypothetical protein
MTQITEQESKDQAEGFMAWRHQQKQTQMTQIATDDKRFGDDRSDREVWDEAGQ